MEPNSAHTNFANSDHGGDYFGDGYIRGDRGFAGGNMAGSRFVENGMIGQSQDFRNSEVGGPSPRVNQNASNSRDFERGHEQFSNHQFGFISGNGFNDYHPSMQEQHPHFSRGVGDRNHFNEHSGDLFRNQENSLGESPTGNWTTHGHHIDSSQSNGFSQQENTRAQSLGPELAMPVYQTLERKDSAWEEKMKTEGHGGGGAGGGDDRASRQEEWAWGTGTKWLGAPSEKPKLNLYAGPPRAEMFENAPKVQGGFGEKLLNRMGWKTGEGLGKTKGGTLEPIKFSEIKTDRRGLDSSARVNDHEKELVIRGGEEEEEEEMTWSKIKAQKEVDRSDPKAVFSEMKSKSFWSWHDTGMKGPENVHQRLRLQKRMVKDKAPLDVSEIFVEITRLFSPFLRWLESTLFQHW